MQNPGHPCEHGIDSYYYGRCPACEAQGARNATQREQAQEAQWTVLYAAALRARIETGSKQPAVDALADTTEAAALLGLPKRKERWACDECGARNDMAYGACLSCYRPRPKAEGPG